MRAVVQRALQAAVTLKETGERREIGSGLLVLLGIGHQDTPADAVWLADKLADLRIFEDAAGRMNVSLAGLPDGAMLIVSQFTLYADIRRGRRPSFTAAAPPEIAVPLYEHFIASVQSRGIHVQTGQFGADMLVEVTNDGPVTLTLDTPSGR